MSLRTLNMMLLPLVLLLGACGTTLKPAEIGDTGYFETRTQLKSEDVNIHEPFNPEFKGLLYVKIDESNERFNTFFIEMFRNMNEFESVVNKSDLEALVLEKGVAEEVRNVSDRIGLNSLANQIGPFLVVEPHAEHEGAYTFTAKLTAFDPSSGRNILELTNEAINWDGLDKPLFYPLFNAFLDWVRGNEIQTE